MNKLLYLSRNTSKPNNGDLSIVWINILLLFTQCRASYALRLFQHSIFMVFIRISLCLVTGTFSIIPAKSRISFTAIVKINENSSFAVINPVFQETIFKRIQFFLFHSPNIKAAIGLRKTSWVWLKHWQTKLKVSMVLKKNPQIVLLLPSKGGSTFLKTSVGSKFCSPNAPKF